MSLSKLSHSVVLSSIEKILPLLGRGRPSRLPRRRVNEIIHFALAYKRAFLLPFSLFFPFFLFFFHQSPRVDERGDTAVISRSPIRFR